MKLAEVGKLLTMIAAFDNRRLDESTARAWKIMLDRELPDATLTDAQEIVFEWFAQERPYFEVRHLIAGLRKRLRLTPREIEADVRSAKARGLIDAAWPRLTPLPPETAKRLAEARQAERAAAPELVDAGPKPPALSWEVGRHL